MTTTYPHPRLTEAPDQLLRPGRGHHLADWCHRHGITPPTLAHLEEERRRRGITPTKGNRP